MGNGSFKTKEKDEFLAAVKKMNKEKNKKSPSKVSTHLEQKYRNHIIEELYKTQFPKHYKESFLEVIGKNILKQDLTTAISVLTALKSNQTETSIFKQSDKENKNMENSKYVRVKFDGKYFQSKSQKKNQDEGIFSGHFQETQEGRVSFTSTMIERQIDKPYHPFRLLCRKFSKMLISDSYIRKKCQSEEQYAVSEKYLKKVVTAFCKLMAYGCLGLYRKWIIQYTGVDNKKYEKWMMSLVVNQIWSVSENCLTHSIRELLQNLKICLKINFNTLKLYINDLNPQDFSIDPELRIEGHYFTSIFQASEITRTSKPSELLKELERVKNCICVDIDKYHELEKKGTVYEINGDNIMGIVAYILCKVNSKIDEIDTILKFLKLIYGDKVYYSMDVASYIYSTLVGAIQFIEQLKFKQKQDVKFINGSLTE